MIKIYGLKNCDSCKKALKGLSASAVVELIDIRANPLELSLLERALAQFGDALINKRSTTWRGLDDTVRGGEALALLQTHPSVMKRPLIEKDGILTLGWDKTVQAQYQS